MIPCLLADEVGWLLDIPTWDKQLYLCQTFNIITPS